MDLAHAAFGKDDLRVRQPRLDFGAKLQNPDRVFHLDLDRVFHLSSKAM